jgi:hypothetical protein
VEDAVAEGDLVTQRVHFEGTHTGEFQGLPPTHRKVSFSGLELNRFVDGRVAEHWFQMDSLTLLQQLGLVVVPGPRLLPRVLAHQLKKLRRKHLRMEGDAFSGVDVRDGRSVAADRSTATREGVR